MRTQVLVAAAMTFVGLGLSTRALNTWDESWFLEVVVRMRHGDVLYRDISYGAGPLPAYLTQAATYVVGINVLAEKLVVVLAFAGTATIAWTCTILAADTLTATRGLCFHRWG